MAVFDSATKIARRVADPTTDKSLPSPKALSYGAMTSPTGLAGCTGVDAKLIHGDRWQQMIGSHTVNITQNETYMVLGNRNTNIVGNYTKVIVGIYNHTTINAHNQINVSVRNNTFICAKIEIHAAPKASQEPTSWLQYIQQNTKGFWFKAEATLIKFDIGGEKMEGWIHKTDLKALGTKMVGIKNKLSPLEVKVNALEQQIRALDSKVNAVQPSIGVSIVHMVSVTVKMLVIGVNQFI